MAEVGGFTFDLCNRNAFLEKTGLKTPKAVKTGTTICGMVFRDGVVLGADTRATEGPIVADKNCEKIHFLADNMYCCGAGTAADTENVTNMISSQLTLLKLKTGRQVRCTTACRMLKQHLYKYQGHISAALVLGGVDVKGPYLCSIHPHGSTDILPYVTMGSGSLAAMATFEDGYKPDMDLEDAKLLVRNAIAAGVFNDLGSGSNIDLCVIYKDDKVDYLRNYEIANKRGEKQNSYKYKRGTTAVLTKKVRDIVDVETTVISMES